MDLFITPLFTIGPFQIVVIVVVALIVFGPVGLGKKLGNLVKGTGQGVKEFKKALEEGYGKYLIGPEIKPVFRKYN